jgi:hypothetical protein
VLCPPGDHHVVGPHVAALPGDHEPQVRSRGEVLQEDVAGPGHGDPGLALAQDVDVLLLVVPADQPGVPLFGKRPRRPAPARRAGFLRVDALLDHAEAAEIQEVRHHPHAALVCGIPQLVDAGDRLLDEVGVPRDAGSSSGPGHAVGIARVERPDFEPGPGVTVEVLHQALVERRQLALRHQLGKLESVGDHHDVVTDGLAGPQDRVDVVVPGFVVLDDLRVAHRNAGGGREVLQGLMPRIDVERPVGEVDMPVPALTCPERRHRILRRRPRHGADGLGRACGGEAGEAGEPGDGKSVAPA